MKDEKHITSSFVGILLLTLHKLMGLKSAQVDGEVFFGRRTKRYTGIPAA